VRQDATEGDSGPDQSIQLLIATNGELQMTGRDPLDFQILSRVACKLQYFGGQVFEDGGDIDSGCKEK